MKYKLHKIYMKPSSDQPLQNKRTFKLFNTVISYHMLMPSLACMFYLLYSYVLLFPLFTINICTISKLLIV